MNQEAQHVDAVVLIGFDEKGMQGGGARTGIHLGLDRGQVEIRQCNPFAPADAGKIRDYCHGLVGQRDLIS